MGFLLLWLLLVQSSGSRHMSPAAVAHGLSCLVVCGIFLDQGLNPCPCIGKRILKHWPTMETQLLLEDCSLQYCLWYLWTFEDILFLFFWPLNLTFISLLVLTPLVHSVKKKKKVSVHLKISFHLKYKPLHWEINILSENLSSLYENKIVGWTRIVAF